MRITVSSKEFQTFISSILNVDRRGATLKIFPDYIECLILSEDNSSIILYAKLNALDITGYTETTEIHVKDMTKFQKLLSMNEGDTFTFSIENNSVQYESDLVVGAKFMLAEKSNLLINSRINVEWFNSFEMTSRMVLNKEVIKRIIVCSSFTSDDAKKVYLYQDGDKVVAEINDRSKNNLDTMSIVIGEIESGKMDGRAIINVGTLSKLFLSDDMVLETSHIGQGISQTEILFLSFIDNNVSIRYLLNTLRS